MKPATTPDVTKADKPSILIFIEYYLPGYKSGGPVRSVANLVSLLAQTYTLFIVTRDRDYGDTEPYPAITADKWLAGAGCRLMYLSPANVNLICIHRLLRQVDADFVYTNSLLGQFTRLLLVLHTVRRNRLIIAPRGELHNGVLRLKAYKKIPFVYLVRAVSRNAIIWHATDAAEQRAIRQIFTTSKVEHVPVRFAPDTPRQFSQRTAYRKEEGTAKLVFLSRITAKKGVHHLLRVLRQFPAAGRLSLDIYGPVGEAAYWQACQAAIRKLPPNCVVTYRGSLPHESVSRVLGQYDFFVLPTLGENFGHAIFEALSVGVPVLISDQTPWRNLRQQGAGWDLPLREEADWLAALRAGVAMGNQQYGKMTAAARRLAEAYMQAAPFQQRYSDLFSLSQPTPMPAAARKLPRAGHAVSTTAIEYHDAIAEAFAARYTRSAGFRERFRVWTALFDAHVPPGSRVLDLGCGSGALSAYLGRKGCEVVGLDGSARMIALCQRHHPGANERYERQTLPLADPAAYASRDVIVASSLLEYLEDLPAVLDQVRMLLRHRGLFLVSMPNRRCLWRRLERAAHTWTGNPAYYRHSRHSTDVATFNRQLERLGFEPIETRFMSSFDPVSRWLKYILPAPLTHNLFVGVYRKR